MIVNLTEYSFGQLLEINYFETDCLIILKFSIKTDRPCSKILNKPGTCVVSCNISIKPSRY